MALPAKLKNFNVYNDAKSWLGLVASITTPKLSRKMEEYRAGGMAAPVEVDLGQELLTAELTLGGIVLQLLQQYGNRKVDGNMLRFAGAYEEESTGTMMAVEIVMRGRVKELDLGESKVGENTETKATYTLSYYKLIINGAETIEIDAINMIERINGVDLLEKQRQALGLL